MILVLLKLTCNFHLSQYLCNRLSTFCRFSGDSQIKIVSSIYSNANILKKQTKLSCDYSTLIPLKFVVRNCSRSLRKIENRSSERFSPWHTPILHGKKSDNSLLLQMQDFASLYMFIITVKTLPLIPVVKSFCHIEHLCTVSKSFLKSTKAQKRFFSFSSIQINYTMKSKDVI